MPKIAIIVNTLQSGGAEKQSIYLYNALQANYETYLVVLHGIRVEDKLLGLVQENNQRILLLTGNLFSKILMLIKFYNSQNITHIFSFLTKPNFIGALTGRIAGVKFIYGSIRNSELPIWKSSLENFISNNLTTETIFNNYSGEQFFNNKGFSKTRFIPNCFINIGAPATRNKTQIVKIITVGRFVEQKDYFTAIKAINELSSSFTKFKFIIVGYGKLEQTIREEVKKHQLENYTEILINPDNIPKLLSQANIYLSTSLFEGTSNSIMEAMNASLPIVATNVGDNNRLVEEAANGFLHEIGDYKNMSRSLKILAEDYELRNQFGFLSNRILKENYSFEKFKNRYLKIIEQE